MADSNSVVGFGTGDANSNGTGEIKTNNRNLVDPSELDKMVAASLKDVNSEDEDDLEFDDELMRQLKEMTEGPLKAPNNQHQEVDRILSTSALITVDILKHRIEMYKVAETNAKATGQSAKVRRLSRGLSRLNDLLKQTNAGEQIIAEDIPPEVTTKSLEGNAAATDNEQNTGSTPSSESA